MSSRTRNCGNGALYPLFQQSPGCLENSRVHFGAASMNYCHPTVTFLGSIYVVVAYTGSKNGLGVIESVAWQISPAYDLDD